jgi:hypothetical protein
MGGLRPGSGESFREFSVFLRGGLFFKGIQKSVDWFDLV